MPYTNTTIVSYLVWGSTVTKDGRQFFSEVYLISYSHSKSLGLLHFIRAPLVILLDNCVIFKRLPSCSIARALNSVILQYYGHTCPLAAKSADRPGVWTL